MAKMAGCPSTTAPRNSSSSFFWSPPDSHHSQAGEDRDQGISVPRDLPVQAHSSLSVHRDLSVCKDLSSPNNLSVFRDLFSSNNLSVCKDLSSPNNLSVCRDLFSPNNLSVCKDLCSPSKLSSCRDLPPSYPAGLHLSRGSQFCPQQQQLRAQGVHPDDPHPGPCPGAAGPAAGHRPGCPRQLRAPAEEGSSTGYEDTEEGEDPPLPPGSSCCCLRKLNETKGDGRSSHPPSQIAPEEFCSDSYLVPVRRASCVTSAAGEHLGLEVLCDQLRRAYWAPCQPRALCQPQHGDPVPEPDFRERWSLFAGPRGSHEPGTSPPQVWGRAGLLKDHLSVAAEHPP
nr:CMRF35-like molecule 9 isoform X10 [Camelus dromedarius]